MTHMTYRCTYRSILESIYTCDYIFTSASWCSKWLTYIVRVCWESPSATMFSKSKRFGDSVHGVSGPGPATYHVKRLFDDHKPKPQQPKQRDQRGRKPRALNPMLLGNRPQAPSCKKSSRNDSSKVESKNAAADSNDWRDIFDINALLGKGGTGMVFSGTLKAERTPVALKRILEKESDQKLVIEFFKEFEMIKRCQHPNVVTVFSAYEVPIPAFTMELLGKTLEQSTAEQHIDNDGILLAFKNAAAAVQYLHSVSIAHRDIKPHNFCHLHCHSWEIKLIDFDAAEELKESCWGCSTSILRF